MSNRHNILLSLAAGYENIAKLTRELVEEESKGDVDIIGIPVVREDIPEGDDLMRDLVWSDNDEGEVTVKIYITSCIGEWERKRPEHALYYMVYRVTIADPDEVQNSIEVQIDNEVSGIINDPDWMSTWNKCVEGASLTK